ncbi:50S ribosomal protein L22 [Candidatus Bathyarchaeota archaeon]|nr:50S ribosomal protein L22 [Candidatus Bathyarchaeota archaeon]
MPKWNYSVMGLDPDRTAKTSGRDLRISPKAAREVCTKIRNMSLDKARIFLQEVIDKRKAVPYRHHKKKVGHKTGIEGFYAGRYPVKTAQEIMKVLDNAEANAEFKGLDIDRLKIVHIAAQRSRKIKGYVPRAFGRATPSHNTLCHIEMIVEEMK